MTKKLSQKVKDYKFPVIIEKDEDGFYFVECPMLSSCYTQGDTIDEALKNIREVIELCLEEKENQEAVEIFKSQEFSLHTISL